MLQHQVDIYCGHHVYTLKAWTHPKVPKLHLNWLQWIFWGQFQPCFVFEIERFPIDSHCEKPSQPISKPFQTQPMTFFGLEILGSSTHQLSGRTSIKRPCSRWRRRRGWAMMKDVTRCFFLECLNTRCRVCLMKIYGIDYVLFFFIAQFEGSWLEISDFSWWLHRNSVDYSSCIASS